MAASGLKMTCWSWPFPKPNEIWLSAMSIDVIEATAAARLIVVTARILPIRSRPRGAGVRSRLSRVFRSRSPAELSSAADKPPVRLIVIRM